MNKPSKTCILFIRDRPVISPAYVTVTSSQVFFCRYIVTGNEYHWCACFGFICMLMFFFCAPRALFYCVMYYCFVCFGNTKNTLSRDTSRMLYHRLITLGREIYTTQCDVATGLWYCGQNGVVLYQKERENSFK